MKKRSVNIHGHQTSITLEGDFWSALKADAEMRGLSINKLIAEIDDGRTPENNLSSAIRIYLFKKLSQQSL